VSRSLPPSAPPGAVEPSGGEAPGARVSVADGLILVAWLVLGQVLLYGIALSVGAIDRTDGTGDRLAQIGILSTVLATSIAWLGLRGRLRGAMAPGRRPRGLDAAIGLGAGVAGFVVLLLALGLAFQMIGFETPEQQALQDVAAGGPDALLAVVLAVCLAPVLEELVFRGALHRGLRHRLGMWPAALLSSAVFAGVHLEVASTSPVFLVQLFLLGVVFAWLYERTGNLLAPITAHLAFNAISMSVAYLAGRFEDLEGLGAAVLPWG
jgi:membrane protease YdiL (CAAX protease family)